MILPLLLSGLLSAPARADLPPIPGIPDDEAPVPTPSPEAPADAAPAVDPALVVGAPAGPPVSGAALREQTHRVAKHLRCPVCQGLSVADSPSESALAMKKEVEDLVAQGYDDEQILMYFEASYGEFIRLEPKAEGLNLLVWGAPGAVLLAGGAWIGWSLRRRAAPSRAPTPPPSPAATDAPPSAASPSVATVAALAPGTDPELEPFLRRVREETR